MRITLTNMWRGALERTARRARQFTTGARVVATLPARAWRTLCVGALFFVAGPVMAALPTPVAPSTGTSTNFIEMIKGYGKDAALAIGLLISVAGFTWVAWGALQKLNDARTGKGEWGDFGIYVAISAGLLLFVMFLLNQVTGII